MSEQNVIQSPNVEAQAFKPMPDLKSGDNGNAVAVLQVLLKHLGLPLTVDGAFGDNTKRRVQEFQRNNNLETDGIVGGFTWVSLIQRSADLGN